MTLNLNKYGSEMQSAWKQVCDVNSDTNWALFCYEGTSFVLKLLSSGSGGLDELKEDLNANKIMYAFIRVEDPKTSLPKFVFLHWQGESTPGTRKGLCATHLSDIEKYFHGAHITITARNEDEVDEDEILEKVSKVTASAFNFKAKPSGMEEAPAPVGTSHKRIVPQKELPSLDEREKFWIQEESKEKERIANERQRKVSELKKLEEERKKREEEEARLREHSIKERERKISQQRQAEVTAAGPKTATDSWQKQLAEDAKDEEERQRRSEELRRARNEEARQLISQRSSNPRSVFERNTSVGQLNFRKPLPTPGTIHNKPSLIDHEFQKPAEVVRAEPEPLKIEAPAEPQVLNANMVSTDDIVVPPPESFGNEESLRPEAATAAEPDVTVATQQPDLIQDVAASKVVPDVTASSIQNGSTSQEYGVCAVALYDYQAADDTEISFDPGQVITHIDQIDPGWWQGQGPDGNYGLFPANYVEVIDPSEIVSH